MDESNILRILATDGQLLNNDFVFDYNGMADSDVRNDIQIKVDVQNVQDVLNKIKTKRYDIHIINQLMLALDELVTKRSKRTIQEVLEYELASMELRVIEYDAEPTRTHRGLLSYATWANVEIDSLKNKLVLLERKILGHEKELIELIEKENSVQDENKRLTIKLLCAVEQTDQDQTRMRQLKEQKHTLESKLRDAEEALKIARTTHTNALEQYVNTTALLRENMEAENTKNTQIQHNLRREADEKRDELDRKENIIERLKYTIEELENENQRHTRNEQISPEIRTEWDLFPMSPCCIPDCDSHNDWAVKARNYYRRKYNRYPVLEMRAHSSNTRTAEQRYSHMNRDDGCRLC